MAVFIECIEGVLSGQSFRIFEGARLGRTTGEVLLPDPKVSALHAQVESSEKGQLILVDRGSSNGIRINGQKTPRIALLPGVVFQVGRSHFRVQETPEEETTARLDQSAGGWRFVLANLVPRLSARNSSQASQVEKFEPMVELEFVAGIQAEHKVVLGYGPRKAGSDVLDIELQDPQAPDIAFEIWPDGKGRALFRTAYPEIVLVNDSHVPPHELNSGDVIRVGSTLIEVKFLE